MIELSIIIPTYGRATKIKHAIQSAFIHSQSEVIVVDDNGQGTAQQLKTESILAELINSKKITYLPLLKNVGGGVARNIGIRQAQGKYITFLDDDDVFIPGKLIEKLNYFKQQVHFEICCSHMQVEENGTYVLTNEDLFVGQHAKHFLLSGSCYTSMIMIKKSALEAIGGFCDTPYLQDHTLLLKAFLKNQRVCVFPQRVFVHRINQGASITSGIRPIAGVQLRCKLEKALTAQVTLSAAERNALHYRWDCIKHHNNVLEHGRNLAVFRFLIEKVIWRTRTRQQCYESLKLLAKFFINYQYYSK
jgi:glycosyltransferase involved in cell wall biosynthesis